MKKHRDSGLSSGKITGWDLLSRRRRRAAFWLEGLCQEMEDLLESDGYPTDLWREMEVDLSEVPSHAINKPLHKGGKASSTFLQAWQPLNVVRPRPRTRLATFRQQIKFRDKADPRRKVYWAAALAALAARGATIASDVDGITLGAAINACKFELMADRISHIVRSHDQRVSNRGSRSVGRRRRQICDECRARGLTNQTQIAREVISDVEYIELGGTLNLESVRTQICKDTKKKGVT